MHLIDNQIVPKYVINPPISAAGISKNFDASPFTGAYDQNNLLIQNLTKEILKRTKLKHGWDGHDGIPVSMATAKSAIQVVAAVLSQNSPLPSIGAGSGGSIFMEWEQNGYEIGAEIDCSCKVHISRTNLETGEDQFYEDIQNYFLLTSWIEEMTLNQKSKDVKLRNTEINYSNSSIVKNQMQFLYDQLKNSKNFESIPVKSGY